MNLHQYRDEFEDNINSKGSITTIFGYDPVFADELGNPLQRFGRVKIEATSFTISEPVKRLDIAPVIYTMATEEQRIL
jgi:hypothetical protein